VHTLLDFHHRPHAVAAHFARRLNASRISSGVVNGPHNVWIERSGKRLKTDISFPNTDHVVMMTNPDKVLVQVKEFLDYGFETVAETKQVKT